MGFWKKTKGHQISWVFGAIYPECGWGVHQTTAVHFNLFNFCKHGRVHIAANRNLESQIVSVHFAPTNVIGKDTCQPRNFFLIDET
jgi:hypothetical protein